MSQPLEQINPLSFFLFLFLFFICVCMCVLLWIPTVSALLESGDKIFSSPVLQIKCWWGTRVLRTLDNVFYPRSLDASQAKAMGILYLQRMGTPQLVIVNTLLRITLVSWIFWFIDECIV